MRRKIEALRWPFLAGVGAVLPLAWWLVSGHTLVWRDSAQLYAPHRVAVCEALRSLRLPAWNPWEATGQPLFAQGLDSVLHPVSLAVALLTPSTDALIVALVLFAALGAWIAARTLGASPAAAAGAALAFALSGYALAMAADAVYLIGTASGPWAVAGLHAAARRRAGWIAAAAGVATLALSGDAGSLAAFTVMGAVLAWAAGRWRGLARAALGAALGVSPRRSSSCRPGSTWPGPRAGPTCWIRARSIDGRSRRGGSSSSSRRDSSSASPAATWPRCSPRSAASRPRCSRSPRAFSWALR